MICQSGHYVDLLLCFTGICYDRKDKMIFVKEGISALTIMSVDIKIM